MLNALDLAKKLHEAIGRKNNGFGAPTSISDQTLNYAKGMVASLTSGVVSNAPGTIAGATAPGAPLSAGAGTGGTMTLQSTPMKAITGLGMPPQALPNIAKENDAIVTYIMTGSVTFAPEGITGNCTNTPSTPGPLVNGAGVNGLVIGLTGADAVAAVSAALGTTGPEMIDHYTALINYILDNASVSYSTGAITGTCPAAGGPLELGTGVGGTIS